MKIALPAAGTFGEMRLEGLSRFFGDTGARTARDDDLVTGKTEHVGLSMVDVSMNGIKLQDCEFITAISEGRERSASVVQVMPPHRFLDVPAKQSDAARRKTVSNFGAKGA